MPPYRQSSVINQPVTLHLLVLPLSPHQPFTLTAVSLFPGAMSSYNQYDQYQQESSSSNTNPAIDGNDSNNDTFLSRVFGLHSIYNQLQDRYQYYDPDIDGTSSYHDNNLNNNTSTQSLSDDADDDDDDDEDSLLRPIDKPIKNSNHNVDVDQTVDQFHPTKSNDNNTLLNSESDLDLSSSESDNPPVNTNSSAKMRKNAGITRNGNDDNYNNNDNLTLNLYQTKPQDNNNSMGQQPYEFPTSPSPSLPPKNRTLKFNVPKVDDAKNYLYNKLNKNSNRNSLPLYNEIPSSSLSNSQISQTYQNGNGNQQFRKQPLPKIGPSIQTIYQRQNKHKMIIPPRERALYLWANIINMDEFLVDLYYYYRGKGLLNIILSRIVGLFILIFILSFTVFLKWGINYDYFLNEWNSIDHSTSITLSDLIIPNYLFTQTPFLAKFLLFGFSCYIILRLIQLYFDYNYKLKEIKNFYKHLIGITNDDELMTISWITIVERLMLLKDYNSLTSTNANLPPHYLNDLNSKIRLNAHDIANRIMRKDNYMIALINKEVLDLSIPIFENSKNSEFLNQFNIFSTKSVLTKTLEWNLKLCINNFVFNNHGQINSKILKEGNRNQLSKELSSRFKMAAIINLILCPFIVVYFVLLYFFRYFNEYKSNPSSLLGLRQYTPWAEWKLREFNELPHFFIKRLHLSIGPANTYISQFPGGFLVINLMSLVNFISGAITAVLVIMGLWFEDEDHSFWSFEITVNKSSLFYISLFGTLWAITLNSNSSTLTNSSENVNNQSHASFFYDPEASLRYVSQFTHYLPSRWNGKLHTIKVKNEFCELYNLKIIIIINEIISLILTPFILWFKVSNNASSIIDFFREYSIHVDGLGYVCYFAMFNFEEKDKNMMYDLNKRKKQSKARSKSKSRAKSKAKANSKARININNNTNINNHNNNHIELNNLNEHTSSGTDSDDSNIDDENYQDDKMIKSYMYFLESYKNVPNENTTSQQPNRTNRKQTRDKTPSNSIMFTPNAGARTERDLDLSESAYNVNYKFNDNDDDNDINGISDVDDDINSRRGLRNKKGVLGMLNQFYKQDISR